jgi:hypothetical protein
MRLHTRISARAGKAIVAVLLVAAIASLLPTLGHGAALASAHAYPKLDASILSWDGKDFTRTETTLMDKGKSAVGSKLDHDSPAYKALSEKHSFSGEATVFGKKYDAHYAPLTGDDGALTGALFVGVPK